MMNSRNKLAVVALLIIVGVVVLSKASKTSLTWTSVYSFNFNDPSIGKVIEQDLQNQKGEYAVFVQDLTDSRKTYSFHGDQVFPTASLYKLVVMATAFQAIKDNKLTLDTPISSTKSHLDSVLGDSNSSYPDAPASIEYSVGESMSRIAGFSDNYAAIMLTEKLRQGQSPDPIQQMARNLGMSHTDFNPEEPITTAEDIGLFFSKLYKGEVVSPEASQKLIDYLAKAEINDRIPAQLPQGLKIAHKTGEFPYLRHDAGIVYLEGKPYVIVMLSQKLEHEDDGIALQAKISKDVYDYFKD